MKNIFLLICLSSTMTIFAQTTWKSDNAHSNINFSISHLKISEVTGDFGKFDIEAKSNDRFDEPTFTVSIETSSINTGNAGRDKHLRSDDFFAAETHPTISFTSSAYEKTGENTFIVKGDLTMRGVTNPVSFKGKLNGIITDQRSKKLKAGLKLTSVINRTAFDVGTVKPFPVGEEVEIVINLEMRQQ
ncbi:YceI family protein [Flavobacteriaceae bacterium F08102]|nr:YceI family protein [Flavobacteriaceae bacterium F08102]